MSSVVSLWDVEDVQVMPAVRDMTVGPVTIADVREFARRYHYTHQAGTVCWRWGLWHGPVLLGVVSYNTASGTACASVFGSEYRGRVWHMGRLSLADVAPRNSESRLIGGSLRAIAREYPETWAILTYAATDQGHIGYVYQATNAIYTGTGDRQSFYETAEGERCTHRGNRGSITVAQAAERGWTQQASACKHRYVYILGTKAQRRQRMALLKLPSLPYPKAEAMPSHQTPSIPGGDAGTPGTRGAHPGTAPPRRREAGRNHPEEHDPMTPTTRT